ncbi:uncharacterized protein LOC142522648 [Primulina tabacum]|uniref:uncharacterized protein LOC142522648 n=1 Tax=Primulina tabacum TaxID=48773 RepID=UPI003F5A524B
MEAEEEIYRTRLNANQETQQNKILSAKDSSDERVSGDSKAGKNLDRDCSIDIKGDVINGVSRRNSESTKAERICRICHFGDESSSELIELGCECKGELGWSHQQCAEAWFWQKGDRRCEICGTMAENVDNKSAEDASIFLMEWNEMRLVAATLDDSDQASSRRCKQYLCRFLAICLVLAFLLPWLFKGIHVL